MKLAAIFEKTIEPFVKEELKALSADFKIVAPGVAVVDADYKTLNIKSSLLQRIGVLVSFGNEKALAEFKYSDYLKSSESFKVKCGDKDVCVMVGQIIKDATGAKVSLEAPEKIFYAEKIDDKLLVYLDTTGDKKLTLRGYASTSDEFITSDAAHAIVMFSGWKPEEVMLDPFCNQGYIVIEALMAAMKIEPGSLRLKGFNFEAEASKPKEVKAEVLAYSPDMADIKNTKQNAKLAGVFKHLHFGSHDLEDLDYKLGENRVDCVITAPPKRTNLDKLFFQIEYVVKKTGYAVVYTSEDVSSYKKYALELEKEADVYGKKLYKLVRAD